MCNAKPGLRCKPYVEKKLASARGRLVEARKAYKEGKIFYPELKEIKFQYHIARANNFATRVDNDAAKKLRDARRGEADKMLRYVANGTDVGLENDPEFQTHLACFREDTDKYLSAKELLEFGRSSTGNVPPEITAQASAEQRRLQARARFARSEMDKMIAQRKQKNIEETGSPFIRNSGEENETPLLLR